MKAVVQPAHAATRRMNTTTRGCLGVIAFLYSAAVFNVILPRMGYSVSGVGHLLALTALTALATVTFLQCVYCDPGRVPPGWQPDAEASSTVMQVKRSGGGARWCKKCQVYKPPRTHHCRRCGHCVLRMDHHCFWVNNCIGHGNLAAFLRMCVYLAAACLHATLLLLTTDAFLVQLALGWDEESQLLASFGSEAAAAAEAASGGGRAAARTGWRGPFWLHALAQVAATALALPVCVGLCVLLGWNAYLALQNKTTIEYHEGVVAQYMSGGGGQQGRHPFDLGRLDNVEAVCGDSPVCWPLPGRAAAAGDGLAFPTWAAQPRPQ